MVPGDRIDGWSHDSSGTSQPGHGLRSRSHIALQEFTSTPVIATATSGGGSSGASFGHAWCALHSASQRARVHFVRVIQHRIVRFIWQRQTVVHCTALHYCSAERWFFMRLTRTLATRRSACVNRVLFGFVGVGFIDDHMHVRHARHAKLDGVLLWVVRSVVQVILQSLMAFSSGWYVA
jgi:hypothetical protein